MNRKAYIENLVRPGIKNINAYSSARDEYNGSSKRMNFLDANENPFNNGVNRYPDPHQQKLKTEISKIKNTHVGNIFLGNGSDEVLDLLFRAFCTPGIDNCITLPPTYGMYGVLAALNDIENREVLLSNSFQPELSRLLNLVDERSKMLFICSPNNPTGNSINNEYIEELLKEFKGLVVIDEAYIDFSDNESWLDRLAEYPNLVIVQTFSKAYGMAGIRLGVCFADSEIIKILNKIKPPYNINELTQQHALNRLKNLEKIKSEIEFIKRERFRLSMKLLESRCVKQIYQSDANFLLIEVDNADKRYQQLINSGIVVRNRSNLPLCKNTLRITVGTTLENDRLISIFNNF